MTCGRKSCLSAALVLGCLAHISMAQGAGTVTWTVQLDPGEALGQNLGTLFEVPMDGYTVGAGFQGLYNTRHQVDRHTVQFFVRPTDGQRPFRREALPRPGTDAGTYLFDLDGHLYSHSQGADGAVRRWDAEAGRWVDHTDSHSARVRVGTGLLAFLPGRVQYEGEEILAPPGSGSYQSFYYSLGHLFFYHVDHSGLSGYRPYESDEKGFSRLYACPWKPGDGAVDVGRAVVSTLPVVGEVPFAYGQLGAKTLTCSNIGGLYEFDGRAFRTIREPQIGVSFQVYSMLNYYDKLLLGQYPTGMLFEYDGDTLRPLENWPPKLPEVTGSSREAQTTAIYGGELYVGVWPWGELWRYGPDAGQWFFVDRMFSHPALTDQTTHPYENQCKALDVVLNQWGQRVTSLLPLGDGLIVSTSAKWPCTWEPKFDFVGGDKWKEYGAVTRLHSPGSLSAAVDCTRGPTTLRFTIGPRGLGIEQDGRLLGTAELPAEVIEATSAQRTGEVTWGSGVFGAFGGAALKGEVRRTDG